MRALQADIEITRRCDLTCPTCFVRAQPHAQLELTTAEILDVMAQLPVARTVLHLTGGEPFLHPGIDELLLSASRDGFSKVVINTHGLALDGPALDRLAALDLDLLMLVSLDGPPGAHDRARGEGAADGARSALAGAASRGIDARPASVLTAELVEFGIGAWHERLCGDLGRGIPLALFPLFVRPDQEVPAGAVGHLAQPRHLREAARQIAALILAGERVSVADYPLLNPLLLRHGVPPDQLHTCGAGRGRFCVQADGWVSPCHPSQQRLVPVGPNLLSRLMRHPLYRAIGRRDFDGCRDCDEVALCGHCRAVVAGRGHPILGDDGWCARVLGSPAWDVIP